MRYIFNGRELTYKKSIEIALQGDSDSTILTFDLERKQNGVDLGGFEVQLLLKGDFMPEPHEDIITVGTGLTVKVSGSRISIDWLVNSSQTYQQGTGTGQFRLISATAGLWHSEIFPLNVGQSMSVDGTIEAQAPSVIVDHTSRILQLEQKTDSEQGDFPLKENVYTKEETYNKSEVNGLVEPIPALQEGYGDLANILDYDPSSHTSAELERITALENELEKDSGTGRLERLERTEGELGALNETLKPFFKNVYFNATNGHLTFEQQNGAVKTVDLPTELMVDSGTFDNETNEIILLLVNGDELRVPIGNLLTDIATEDYVLGKVAAKQDKLTFDSVPMQNSDRPVRSGGVYSALESKQDKLQSGVNIKTIFGVNLLGSGDDQLPVYFYGSHKGTILSENEEYNYQYHGADPTTVNVTTDWQPSFLEAPLGEISIMDLCYCLAIEAKNEVPSNLQFTVDLVTFKSLDFYLTGNQLVSNLHFNIIPDQYDMKDSKLVTESHTITGKYEHRVFAFRLSGTTASILHYDLFVYGEGTGGETPSEPEEPPSEEWQYKRWAFELDMIPGVELSADLDYFGYDPSEITATFKIDEGQYLTFPIPFFALYMPIGIGDIETNVSYSSNIDLTKMQFALDNGTVDPQTSGFEFWESANVTTETYNDGTLQGLKCIVDLGGGTVKDVILANDGTFIVRDHAEEENGEVDLAEVWNAINEIKTYANTKEMTLPDIGLASVTAKGAETLEDLADVGLPAEVAPLFLAAVPDFVTISSGDLQKLIANKIASSLVVAGGDKTTLGCDNISYSFDSETKVLSMTLNGCYIPAGGEAFELLTLRLDFIEDSEDATVYNIRRAVLKSPAGIIKVEKTLEKTEWSDKEQTITVSGVTANSVVWINPKDTSRANYITFEIYALDDHDNGEITFTCSDTPDTDIDVIIAFAGGEQ